MLYKISMLDPGTRRFIYIMAAILAAIVLLTILLIILEIWFHIVDTIRVLSNTFKYIELRRIARSMEDPTTKK